MNGYTVENLNLELTASSSGASIHLQLVRKELEKLKGVARGGAGLTAVVRQIEKLNTAVSHIPLVRLNALERTLKAMSNVQGFKMNLGSISSQTQEAVAEVEQAKSEISDAMSGNNYKLITEGMTVDSHYIDNMFRIGEAAKSAKDSFAAFEKAGLIPTAKATTKTTTALGKLGKAFGRIMLYRAIRTIIKEIGQAFTEGVKNAYQYSKAMDGAFAKSMDRASTSSLYLKNSLGAALMPAIQSLVPVLEWVIDKFVSFINVINQLFAILGGQSTWTKAVKTQKEFAEATGGAAKELNRMVLGFDELNKLSSQNSGGGSALEDYTKMFEEVGLTDFGSKLKMTIDDLKVDWKVANEEQILEKILVGMSALAGGVIGWKLGGVKGAIIGTIAGATLGLILTSLTFNHNGKIDPEEFKKLIVPAIAGLAGGAFGFMATGTASGAFLGFQLGIALTGIVYGLEFLKGTVYKESVFANLIGTAIAGCVGGLFGFKLLGGTAGGLLGFALGISLSLAIRNLSFDWSNIGGAAKTALSNEIQNVVDQNFETPNTSKVVADIMNSKYPVPTSPAGEMIKTPKPRANGGFVPTGEMFIAGEAGAELITPGRGGVNVRNGSQIAEDVAIGNESVVNALETLIEVVRRKPTGGISQNDIRTAYKNTQMRYGV